MTIRDKSDFGLVAALRKADKVWRTHQWAPGDDEGGMHKSNHGECGSRAEAIIQKYRDLRPALDYLK